MSSSNTTGQLPFWSIPEDDLLASLATSNSGLTDSDAAERLAQAGPNTVHPQRHTGARLLLRQFINPVILILTTATVIALALGEVVEASIILVIIVASGLLSFVQERGANQAVAALLRRVSVEVEVRRGGSVRSIPIDQVMPGDIVILHAGDVIPGDGRILESRGLLFDEALLTGESYPVEKSPDTIEVATPLNQRRNAAFMGSHVASGTGAILIVHTGRNTEFGKISTRLERRVHATGFERGITEFGYLLVRAVVVLVTAIFVINLALNRPFIESFLFSLALAVGLTPQLLPAIVTISLSTGARAMARQLVIVKRLDAIEDFGSMDVLCTDKTGTVTEGAISLAAAVDLAGRPSDTVRRLAWLNAHFQTGYANPLDGAILQSQAVETGGAVRLDEIAYDFTRKRLSVLVADGDETLLVTKGALDRVVAVCDSVDTADGVIALAAARDAIDERLRALSAEGFRVLGVAARAMPGTSTCSVDDETGMTLKGFLAFADAPKAGAADAIRELTDLGIAVKMITGDNRLAAAHAGAAVGLSTASILTGDQIRALDDHALPQAVEAAAIFAEIEPVQKERIVRAMQAAGRTVGFLGDGINDTPALHAADVGISVDTAADVAKQSAAIVLLDKQLAVIADGVRVGRSTFANTLKYINVTISANFGNMLSMAAAAAFLPFLPLLPRQILLLNFLCDIPGTTIARDRVDPEQVERPRGWDIASIRTFMIIFGAISSCFDVVTFVALRTLFNAGETLFRSGWFFESVMTELTVMLVLRTQRPFYRSRPGGLLLSVLIIVGIVMVALLFSPLAKPLGLQSLPLSMVLTLLSITALYTLATELAKTFVYRRRLIK